MQDECANGPFDTPSLLGRDAERGTWFSWSNENHGSARQYRLTRDGPVWTFMGDQAVAPHLEALTAVERRLLTRAASTGPQRSRPPR